MPHEWNNAWVVTADELVPRFYNTLKTLQSAVLRYKDKDYGLRKLQSGGKGRPMLIAYDSLPKEIQDEIGNPAKREFMEKFYDIDKEADRFFSAYTFDDGTRLKVIHKEEYITNASMLKACAELKRAREFERRTKGGSMKNIMKTVLSDAMHFNQFLKARYQTQHTLPTSLKRFKELFKEFTKPETGYNYACLISKKHNNKNRQVVSDEIIELLNDMFADFEAKPTRSEVSRQYEAFLSGYLQVINPDTGELYDHTGYPKISDSTIVNYLGTWYNKIGTYTARSGDRQRDMARFKPHHSFKRPQHAGRIISVDDRQPPFEYAPSQRPWFYNGIDLASEAFTCWVHGKSKQGIIIEFYRQMVRNYTEWGVNLPLEIECESSLNSSFRDTILRPGVMFDHIRIEANNARGKRIEAYYRQLRYAVEKGREGWLARPHAISEANQEGPAKRKLIPYQDIIKGCLKDIEDWNNTPHSVHKEKTRWEVFMEMQTPDTKPTNWPSLLPRLGFKTETSCNRGLIRLQGKEFVLGDYGNIYTGQPLINAMKKIEGRKVDVYWLDGNDGNVLKAIVFYDDAMICEAIAKPVVSRSVTERTPEENAAFALYSKYVATIEAFRRERVKSLNDIVIIDNRQKTLNRKFVIPGLTHYEVKEDQPTEILPPAPTEEEDMFLPPDTSFVKSLADRY